MKTISYSQNAEDILLKRALQSVSKGFYIDVGANDPEKDSVTKLFYESGWSGINIEPLEECYQRLELDRPRDINIKALLGSAPGVCDFYEFPSDDRFSTTDKETAERIRRMLGLEFRHSQKEVLDLTTVCERHAAEEIHFLKIDVEGHEAEVLTGFDLSRFRPWILVIEATEPNSQIDASARWEPDVFRHGYEFACFDGLSKFYVAKEHGELKASLQVHPNIMDFFITAEERKLRDELNKTNSFKWMAKRTLQLLGSRLARQFRKMCGKTGEL